MQTAKATALDAFSNALNSTVCDIPADVPSKTEATVTLAQLRERVNAMLDEVAQYSHAPL
jgi:hypothetical protein